MLVVCNFVCEGLAKFGNMAFVEVLSRLFRSHPCHGLKLRLNICRGNRVVLHVASGLEHPGVV